MKTVTKADFDFSTAAEYRKIEPLLKAHVRQAERDEKIVTNHSAGKETENTAQSGDYIIKTSDEDDGYVMKADRFFEVYEDHPTEKDFYRTKIIRRGLLTLEDVAFTAPWGETMNVRAGGMIIEAGENIYGIDIFSFIRKYGRVDMNQDRVIFALLSEPLDDQLYKAGFLDLENHVRDIELRMRHPHLFQ